VQLALDRHPPGDPGRDLTPRPPLPRRIAPVIGGPLGG
jgi:hypothetical protein